MNWLIIQKLVAKISYELTNYRKVFAKRNYLNNKVVATRSGEFTIYR